MPYRPMMLRGKRVLARCAADGSLLQEGGRVEVRYSPRDGKAYHASVRNLDPIPDEPGLLPDDHCAAVSPSAPTSLGATKTKAGAKPLSTKRAPQPASAPPTRPDPGEVIAYCDGACSGNPGPAGVGVVLLHDDTRWELSEYLGQGTNNIGELTGVLRACEQTPDKARPLHVYTDSTYAIGVLQQGWKAKANQELVAACRAAMGRVAKVSLHYVKGHAGIPLNEAADSLAVSAVERRRSVPWTKVSG